jgi:hypothetical protein
MPPRRPCRWLLAGASLCLLAAVGGCEELDQPSQVHDLRLLAVTAEPPEVILDPSAPAAVPEIEVKPLIADPAGAGRPVTWTVRACANDPLAPSAPGAGAEGAGNYPAGGARSTVGSTRCPPEGPTSWPLLAKGDYRTVGGSIRFVLTPDQLAAAFAADVFPGHLGQPHGGFDLGLPITLEVNAVAGRETALGIKRVVFWQAPLRPDHRANSNPLILEVRVFGERDPLTLDPIGDMEVLAADSPRPLLADQSLWFEPAGVLAEAYVTSVVDRFTDETRLQDVPAETLRYAFYATAGKFLPPVTTSELPFGATPTERVHIESRYEPPAASELPTDPITGQALKEVTIWIVARDERGGSSWVERRLLVQAPGVE